MRISRWLACVLTLGLLSLSLPLPAGAQTPITFPYPYISQKAVNASSGSVATLVKAFTSTTSPGNTFVVSFCNGNINAPTAPITDTQSSTWVKAVHQASAALECDIWFATGTAGGTADSITVTPGGTNASIAMEIYEIEGTLEIAAAQPTAGSVQTGTGSSATAATLAAMTPHGPNQLAIAAIGLGTPAAQTITPGTNWTNDSGQQNPATPSVLFSFVSMSQLLDNLATTSVSGTFTSAPWVIVSAAFKPAYLPVEGSMKIVGVTPSGTYNPAGVSNQGGLYVHLLPETTFTSYHASSKFAASSTTDNAVLPGNATNTVLLVRVLVTCTQTTAGQVTLSLIKRSAADTSGTSAGMTAVPDDSTYAAAVSAPLSYTGTGPTAGAAVGTIDQGQIGCMAAATATPNDIYIFRPLKPVVLRGTAQQLAVNVGNAALTGGNLTVTYEWIETTTP